METILNVWSRYWRLVVAGLVVIVFAYIFLFRGLSTLTGGLYSQTELVSQQQSASLSAIYQDPINAPYKLLVWAGLGLGDHNILSTRVAAALLAGCMGLLFYWVVLHWYSRRISFISTALFITSSGFLHTGRYGTGLVLQMATLVLICCVFFYQQARRETLATYLLVAVFAACLYIPGMAWFALLGIIIMRKRLGQMFKRLGRLHTGIICALGGLLMFPLVWASVQNPAILRDTLGLPATMPMPAQLLDNAIHLVSSIVYRGYWPNEYWLYGAPLLNASEVILFIAGLLLLVQKPILRSNHFLIGALPLAAVLIILDGTTTIALMTPLIYLTIAGGIFYLLDQWLAVFPRNPIARATGMTFMGLLAVFSVLYHANAYYTAWPHAAEMKATYSVAQPRQPVPSKSQQSY